MKKDALETLYFGNGIEGSLYPDDEAAFEEDLGVITYNKRSRYTLGTAPVEDDRDQEIAQQIEAGELIGTKVYAYVHGGSMLATKPFSDQWDSGRSGWVYCSAEAAIKEWGKKGEGLTDEVKAKALSYLNGVIERYNQYLSGDIYYYLIENADRDVIESLSNIWGRDDAMERMKQAGERLAQEAGQAAKPTPR